MLPLDYFGFNKLLICICFWDSRLTYYNIANYTFRFFSFIKFLCFYFIFPFSSSVCLLLNTAILPEFSHGLTYHYESPSSGEAYRDRQLITNFELWLGKKNLFADMDSKTVSICPYPEKRSQHSFVNISATLVIDTSMERSSRVLHHRNPKIWIFFFQKNSNFDF